MVIIVVSGTALTVDGLLVDSAGQQPLLNRWFVRSIAPPPRVVAFDDSSNKNGTDLSIFLHGSIACTI
jgi:hypothetical protein